MTSNINFRNDGFIYGGKRKKKHMRDKETDKETRIKRNKDRKRDENQRTRSPIFRYSTTADNRGAA